MKSQYSITNNFFWYNPQIAGKCHPGKINILEHDIIQHKSPLRNIFFFVDHIGWDME